MNKSVLVVLFLLSVLLVGCSQNLSNEELKTKIINAQNNLNSYKQVLDANVKMSSEFMGQKINITSTMSYDSQVDKLSKKLFMKGTIKSGMGTFKQEMDINAYIVGDYMYTNVLDTWIKVKSDQNIWAQQDYAEQIDMLIQSGSVKLLREELLEGQNYYVVELKPDTKKLVEMFMKQQQSSLSIDNLSNIGDMIKEYTATLWINKNTFVVERSQVSLKMEFEKEQTSQNITGSKLSIESLMDMKLYDINKPVTITLPIEAQNAKEMNLGTTQKKNSLTGAVIADVMT